MIKKQTRIIIICFAIFAVLLAAYFLVIKPLLAVETKETEPPVLLEGEVLGANNRILMFEHIEKAMMKSIEVHNEFGTYTFYRGKDDSFYIEGMEGAPYSLELFSSLVVSSGYTLSMKRLDDLSEDRSAYGFGKDDIPAWYVVTKTNGTKYKVLIGKEILTGAGYYCMYEGRDAVYILDSSIASTLLADVRTLITPSLGYPVSTASYTTVDDFIVIKDGEVLIHIDMLTPEENKSEAGTNSYVFKTPARYSPNLSAYSAILEKLSNLVGSEVVACGNDLEELDDNFLLDSYGINIKKPHFLLHYLCDKVETFIIFSEPDEDGVMYAYSSVFNLVAKIDITAAPFVKWGLLNYVDRPLFMVNINDVANIKIKGEINNGNEKLPVDTEFTLDGEGETIDIRHKGRSRRYDADEVKNFRQLYKVMIGLRLQDYTDRSDKENLTELAEMTITADSGDITTYNFYTYSTRRCFYTVNGEGEFYVLRDNVEKLLRDTDRMINGKAINSDAKD